MQINQTQHRPKEVTSDRRGRAYLTQNNVIPALIPRTCQQAMQRGKGELQLQMELRQTLVLGVYAREFPGGLLGPISSQESLHAEEGGRSERQSDVI